MKRIRSTRRRCLGPFIPFLTRTQSTSDLSAIAAARSWIGSVSAPITGRTSSTASAQFVGQPHNRPGHRHSRGVGAGLAELGSYFPVLEPELEAQHECLALLVLERSERSLVLFERFGSDSRLLGRDAGGRYV